MQIWHGKQEDDAAGVLGLKIEQNKSASTETEQVSFINCELEALGLDVGTVNGKTAAAEAKSLVKDTNGEVAHGDFSYSSVVGMLV